MGGSGTTKQQIPRRPDTTPTSATSALVGGPGSGLLVMTKLRSCICCLALLAFLNPHRAIAQKHSSANTFLVASDLHFNPVADAGLVPKLIAADPTMWEAILRRSQPAAFSQYGEDTNWWLLRSALDAMRSTLPHPAFILVTGDLLAHEFPQRYQRTAHDSSPEGYRKFVRKTVEFLALELRKRFPATQILLTPGNNDDDCGDYNIEAGGPFLHDTAAVARKLARADDEFSSSWEALGSYDVPNPAIRGARIISLNTIFFSKKYRAEQFSAGCATVPSNAASGLVAWLEARLSRAKQAHEKVWLMFHIPPGMDGYSSIQQYEWEVKQHSDQPPAQLCAAALVPMWAPKWTEQFDALLQKYQGTVVASFAGHTHADDFRVINAATNSPSFVLINPAISPIYNQNPAFRVATFAKDGSLADDSVYYLTNLLFAGSTTPGEWKREYKFSQQWNMRGVNAVNLATLYGKIVADETDGAEWLKLYNASSAAAHLPAGTTPGLYCAIEGLDAEAYGNCFCSAMTQAH